MRRRTWAWLAAGALAAGIAVAGGAWIMRMQTTEAADMAEVDPPTTTELESVAAQRVFFAHQSVGRNIIGGLKWLYADSGIDLEVVGTAPPEGAGGFFAQTDIGVNGDPLGKLAEFRRIVDGPLGARLDVAILKFCYVDVTAATDVDALFAAYTSTLDRLEATHPGIRFVHATAPLTTDRSLKAEVKALLGHPDLSAVADHEARQRYNDLVRARYGASGSLFDIAAVEATLSTDPAMHTDRAGGYAVLNSALAADPGHLNALGARLAAGELVQVLAGP